MFENYKKSKIEQRGLGSRIAAQAYLWLLLVVLYAPILLNLRFLIIFKHISLPLIFNL